MKYKVLFILIFSSITLIAQQKSAAISKFVNTKGFENASISICVKDSSGKTIYEHNKKTALTPASILKVVTTASALEALGADYRIKTELAADSLNKNKLTVIGYGDPTLGSEYMDESPTLFLTKWADEAKKNIQQPIELIIDDSFFGYKGVSRRWIREDVGNYYAAGSYGISIFDNAYKLYFDTQNGKAEIIKTEPEISELKFTNSLTLNKNGEDNGYIIGEPFSYNRLLSGDIPSGKKLFCIKGDIPDPGLLLCKTFAQNFAEIGIKINSVKTIREDYLNNKQTDQYNRKVFYTHLSPPLKDIIRTINVRSNNHFAEHLIRQIGCYKESTNHTDPLSKGIEIVDTLWKARGLNTDALFMYDGCGLSPSNAVSAEFMCDILHYMQTKSIYKDVFFASLPKAGKEGTVRNVLKGTKLEGKVYMKSGSIANVQCFAGYILKDKQKYSFTIMVNKYTCPRRQVVSAIESLLLSIGL